MTAKKLKINALIDKECKNKFHKNTGPRERLKEKNLIKNVFQCSGFIYQGKYISHIEFEDKDKDFYKRQIQSFSDEFTKKNKADCTATKNNRWIAIEIDESEVTRFTVHQTGIGDVEILKFAGRANFWESNDKMRFKVKSKDHAGHPEFKNTRMLINIDTKEQLNDYPMPYISRLIVDYPDKKALDEAFDYIEEGEECVVDLKSIKHIHFWGDAWGHTSWNVKQDPNNNKVIRKVGEVLELPKKPGETPIPTPLSQEEAKKLEELRKQVREAIKAALNQDPVISSSELSGGNWEELLNFLESEQKINELKDEVLKDIKAKRDRENETPDNYKKPKLDENDEKNFQNFKNKTIEEIDNNTLASGIKVLIRMEGETDYKNEIDKKMKPSEDELIKRDSRLYKEKVIEALNERISDGGINKEKLDEETKRLINNEITDINQFRVAKDKAIKIIGELGAKSRWTSLLSQAEQIIQKAKKNLTEKIKKNIKIIQEQLKSFKSGANSYLTSFYQQDKTKVDKLEKDLESISATNQTGSPNKTTPWGIIVSVSLVAVVAIAVAVVLVRRKRKLKI